MTLKEKIRPHVKYWDCYNDEPIKYDHENKLAKIADNYAIEFAEWLNDWCVKDKDNTSLENIYKHSLFNGYYTIKDLLEIFKKENKL